MQTKPTTLPTYENNRKNSNGSNLSTADTINTTIDPKHPNVSFNCIGKAALAPSSLKKAIILSNRPAPVGTYISIMYRQISSLLRFPSIRQR